MTKAALLFSLTLLSHICALEVLGTSCVEHPTQRRAFRNAEAIFLGKIVSVDYKSLPPEPIREFVVETATFKVEKIWKGKKLDQISVWRRASSSIGFGQLKVGEQMLIYGEEQHGELIVDLCSRSTKFTQSADLARELGNLNSRWFRFWARVNPF